FQALRIEVNGELAALERALPAAIDVSASRAPESISGGRIVVLSYHSLEDRVVKRVFAAGATSTAPPGFPVELPEHAPVLQLIGRGETPDAAELEANPRAASARLRAAEKLREPRCA
ncbi:MAG TPA: 16S rRNA (cytosine(1402)-N(4))-methyltransferase, partial [Sporichthyaceae bacterium]|nr:16S rRNA (cytosine(1402)-N(4))-methyltransferase [Sporichthyaceae bacterium]